MLEFFGGMKLFRSAGQRCGRHVFSPVQAGQLLASSLSVKGTDLRIGAAVPLFFYNEKVTVRHCGDLGQMGDAKDLLSAGDRVQLFADTLGCNARNARVDLVKYQRLDRVVCGEYILHGQHDPTQLAAGGDAADAAKLLARVCGHEKTDTV